MESIVNQFGRFWTGPFGVRIPWAEGEVPAIDGVNAMRKQDRDDGKYEVEITELFGGKDSGYSVEEFRELYCVQRSDGYWYWDWQKAVRAQRVFGSNGETLYGGEEDW